MPARRLKILCAEDNPYGRVILNTILTELGHRADFVGSGESFAFGFSALAKGGRLVVVGLMGGATSFSPAMLPMKSAIICGSYVGSLAEMAELMQLARSGVLPAMPVTAPTP